MMTKSIHLTFPGNEKVSSLSFPLSLSSLFSLLFLLLLLLPLLLLLLSSSSSYLTQLRVFFPSDTALCRPLMLVGISLELAKASVENEDKFCFEPFTTKIMDRNPEHMFASPDFRSSPSSPSLRTSSLLLLLLLFDLLLCLAHPYSYLIPIDLSRASSAFLLCLLVLSSSFIQV